MDEVWTHLHVRAASRSRQELGSQQRLGASTEQLVMTAEKALRDPPASLAQSLESTTDFATLPSLVLLELRAEPLPPLLRSFCALGDAIPVG